MKTALIGIMVIAALLAGWIYLTSSDMDLSGALNRVTKPTDEHEDSDPIPPFTISNVVVHEEVLTLDEGDPQTDDDTFQVTWDYTSTSALEPGNVYIYFSVVDKDDEPVIDSLRGMGHAGSHLEESALLRLPSLCSVSPTENCMPDERYDSNQLYRLKGYAWNCRDTEITPLYCSDEDKEAIDTLYSNWFRLKLEK